MINYLAPLDDEVTVMSATHKNERNSLVEPEKYYYSSLIIIYFLNAFILTLILFTKKIITNFSFFFLITIFISGVAAKIISTFTLYSYLEKHNILLRIPCGSLIVSKIVECLIILLIISFSGYSELLVIEQIEHISFVYLYWQTLLSFLIAIIIYILGYNLGRFVNSLVKPR